MTTPTTTTTDSGEAFEAAKTRLAELEQEQTGLSAKIRAAALKGDARAFDAAVSRKEQLPFLIEAARREVVRTELPAIEARIAAHQAAGEPLRRRVEETQAAFDAARDARDAAVTTARHHGAAVSDLLTARKFAWRRLQAQEAADASEEGVPVHAIA